MALLAGVNVFLLKQLGAYLILGCHDPFCCGPSSLRGAGQIARRIRMVFSELVPQSALMSARWRAASNTDHDVVDAVGPTRVPLPIRVARMPSVSHVR